MRIWKLVALVWAAFAMPAHAATIVGETEGGYYFGNPDIDLTDPGDYLVSIVFSAPVTGLYFGLEFEESYNEYSTEDGSWFGGNDLTFYQQISGAGPLTETSFTFSFTPSYDYKANGFRYVGTTALANSELEFDSAGPTTYTITLSQLGAVPEPAAWALMILGFGAIGGALRSRRKAASTTAAIV